MDHSSIRQLLNYTHQNKAEVKRRRLTLFFISYVGSSIMAILAIENLMVGNNLLAFLLGLWSCAIFFNAIFSHLYSGSDVHYYIAGVLVIFMSLSIVYTGGYKNTGLYFIFPLLFIQIIIVGYKAAIIYVIATMGSIVYGLYTPWLLQANYADEHVTRFLISAFCFICVAFIGEFFWNQSRKEMYRDTLENMRQANTDPLTKLPNRRFLEAVYFARATEDPADYFPLSVVILDIDHFKVINDTYGHDVGDDVLVYITKLMKASVRATDIVARTGGEEFLIIFPSVNLSNAIKLAEKMRAHIENNPYKSAEIEHRVTASLGVQTALTDAQIEEAIKQADINLYEAKRTGRNKVV